MRQIRSMIVFFGALTCLLVPRPAHSYPISPVPLWELTEEADLIVLGDVTGVEEWSDEEESSMRDADSSSRRSSAEAIAHLTVREVWKGEAGAQVEVGFNPNTICPAPARYVPGKLVAAFLSRGEDGWYTVGLSYGTLYPAAGEVGDLRDRVQEAVTLHQPGVVDPRDRVAWHVRAAARPATRWHGLYGLKASSDSLHYYYDSKIGVRAAEPQLTTIQFEAIARGFVERPSLDRTLPMILALFEERPHSALDRAAIAAVEGVLLWDKTPWWIGETLERLLRRLGDPDPKARLQPLGERYTEVSTKLVREIWAGAKRDLHLPEIPAAPAYPVEVWRTGGNTPS
jgi:hypothetical protein